MMSGVGTFAESQQYEYSGSTPAEVRIQVARAVQGDTPSRDTAVQGYLTHRQDRD